MSSANIIRSPQFNPNRDVLHAKTVSTGFARVAQRIVCDPDRSVGSKITGFIPALIINCAATVIAVAESIASLTFAVFLTSLHLSTFCRSEGLQDKTVKCWGYFFNSSALIASLVLWIPNMCLKDPLKCRASLDFLHINCAQAAHSMGRIFDVFACRRRDVSKEKVYVAAMQGIAQIIHNYPFSFQSQIFVHELGNLSARDVARYFQHIARPNSNMYPYENELSRLTVDGVRLVARDMLQIKNEEDRRAQEDRNEANRVWQGQLARFQPREQERLRAQMPNHVPLNPVNPPHPNVAQPVRPQAPVNPVVQPQPLHVEVNRGLVSNAIQIALDTMVQYKERLAGQYFNFNDPQLDLVIQQVNRTENMIRVHLNHLDAGAISERNARESVLGRVQITEALYGDYLRIQQHIHINRNARLWMQSVLDAMIYLRLHLEEPRAANHANLNNGRQQGAAQAAPVPNHQQAVNDFEHEVRVNPAAQAAGPQRVAAVGDRTLDSYLNYLEGELFKKAAKQFFMDLNNDSALLNLIPLDDYADDQSMSPEEQKQARINNIKEQAGDFLEITNIMSRFVALEEVVSAAEKIQAKIVDMDDCEAFHICPKSLDQRFKALNEAIFYYNVLSDADKMMLKNVLVTANTEGCNDHIQKIFNHIGTLASHYYLNGECLGGNNPEFQKAFAAAFSS